MYLSWFPRCNGMHECLSNWKRMQKYSSSFLRRYCGGTGGCCWVNGGWKEISIRFPLTFLLLTNELQGEMNIYCIMLARVGLDNNFHESVNVHCSIRWCDECLLFRQFVKGITSISCANFWIVALKMKDASQNLMARTPFNAYYYLENNRKLLKSSYLRLKSVPSPCIITAPLFLELPTFGIFKMG